MKIVIMAGTGLIGSKTVAILRQGGHEVVPASPKKRRQQHHRRGPQRGHGRRAGLIRSAVRTWFVVAPKVAPYGPVGSEG